MKKRKIVYLILLIITSLLVLIEISGISNGVDSGYAFSTKGHIFDPSNGRKTFINKHWKCLLL